MFVVGKGFVTNEPILWIEFALSILIFVLSILACFKVIRRRIPMIVISVGFLGTFLCWFFNLTFLWTILLVLTSAFVITVFVINQSELRPYVANSLSGQLSHKKQFEKVFDRHAAYEKIATAVEILSKSKIGAIITLERNTKLDDFMKSGTTVNAPITPELLTTIFYPGTRLHDGAVVIRRDQIVSASVYYTPTTKPLTGKYGSRHRAAIGISEVSDSVTIVVSEETGRISLAVGGELIHANPDNFLRMLEDYSAEETEEK